MMNGTPSVAHTAAIPVQATQAPISASPYQPLHSSSAGKSRTSLLVKAIVTLVSCLFTFIFATIMIGSKNWHIITYSKSNSKNVFLSEIKALEKAQNAMQYTSFAIALVTTILAILLLVVAWRTPAHAHWLRTVSKIVPFTAVCSVIAASICIARVQLSKTDGDDSSYGGYGSSFVMAWLLIIPCAVSVVAMRLVQQELDGL